MMVVERTDPNPSAFIYSLRSVGYSFETAVADIIDNSISAGATKIKIFFQNTDTANPVFAIIDNGTGMDSKQLKEAMRLGSTNPLEQRNATDLGRFGLGMKTASFSICKRLTVISSVKDQKSGACWDLDEIATNNSWDLDILSKAQIKGTPFEEFLPKDGTAIVWEKIDRLIDFSAKDFAKEFNAAISSLEKHLSITFHRYIAGEPGLKKISIFINEHQIEAFDPFNTKNPATQILETDEINIDGSKIVITPYILPHHSKTQTDEYERYAGEGGYLANQGFYVYRNKRLIVKGSWFRLAAPGNLTKLARVRIDIPNTMDEAWNIDVKKSTATPPIIIRDRLKSTIEKIMGKSARTYTARGARLHDSSAVQMWEQVIAEGKVSYKINPSHPLVSSIREKLDPAGEAAFCALLDMIAKCFPTELLFSDYGTKPQDVVQNDIDLDALVEVAKLMIADWIKNAGMSRTDALRALERIVPFNKHISYLTERLTNDNK